jgi:peptidoglycan/xylan/chitin deacetylase (PgdA/CDA1 family)
VLFRAPDGSYDDYVVWTALEEGMRYVQWSVQARDWDEGRGAGAIATAVLRSVRPGSIVLLHDGGGDRSATIDALPRIIRGIRGMGLEFVALSG